MENFDLKKFLVENNLTLNSRLLKEESTLSNSEKSAAIVKLGNSYPKLLGGSQQKAEIAKMFRRSKDNKFTIKDTPYSEQEVLAWFEEPWAEGMFTKDDKDAVAYYFSKWPKKGSEIEIKGYNISHFVSITPTAEKTISQKYPNGKIVDIDGLFVYEWQQDGKTYCIAHSLDDTWFKMVKVADRKYKIDDIIYR